MTTDGIPTIITLTEAQMDTIAEEAANRAVEKLTKDVYAAVGKTVLEKLAWIVGALAVGAFVWAQGKGLIKP